MIHMEQFPKCHSHRNSMCGISCPKQLCLLFLHPLATGDNIRRLRLERGMTVRDLQNYFGFEEPRAIYKWQKGESLPTVDNLYALGTLFEVPMEQILIPAQVQLHMFGEQQAESCCSNHFSGHFGYGKSPMQLQPFSPFALLAA